MAAFDPATLDRWRALAIVDRDGGTVGTISEFYLDRETGYPTWALINTGLFGTTQTFVPLVHAIEISDGLQVPYEKRHIKDAPRVDLHDELSPDEEAALFAHYGVEYGFQPEADAGAGPVVDTENQPGEPPGAVPAGAGLTGSPAAAPEPAPGEPPGPVPADPGSADSGRSQVEYPEGTAIAEGAAIPEGTETSEGTGTPERPGDPDLERTSADGHGLDSSQAEPADPDLSRTAPVAHGLPGSTAASPYGFGPPTIDKGAHPSEFPSEEPSRPPAEAGWAPGTAASFEEQEPVSRPGSASDHWRKAKAAAERERIARAAAQPEERSPLERARRRLERLVGGGQDHPDPEDISPAERDAAERDAAERARRARLGLDEEDHRRKR
jgi:PRC-barrel domain